MKTYGSALLLALLLVPLLGGCGYHTTGTSTVLPKTVQTIAVPAFRNVTTQYRVSDLLGEAVTRELISRTKYHVTAKPEEGDATLLGSVVGFVSYPTIYDPIQARATGVQAIVTVQITLFDKAGKVLFTRPNFEVRERYEISVDPKNYFDESEPAMQRLANDVARSVVSAMLEAF